MYSGKSYAKAQGLDTTKLYGIIDSQRDVGGWTQLNSLPAPIDTDHDGMPDAWETARGLNPNNANDRNTIGAEGYTMLEIYLNSLVGGNPSTTTDIEQEPFVPTQFSLGQNYPNPFNPSTSFQFAVASFQFVSMKAFDLLGREVAVLVNQERAPGVYHVSWNASAFPSGVYFCHMRAGSFVQTRKMVLTK
jgi:hypothetical protein